MKTGRAYGKVTVSRKAERSVLAGHPWIYDTEIQSSEGSWENGSLVDVVSIKGSYLGTGFWSGQSKIRVRLISENANDRFDEAFYIRRLRHTWDYRKAVMRPEELGCCRILFGEADRFPGLTVDRFNDVLVTQTLSIGIEKLKPLLFPLLLQTLREDGQHLRGIYERNDVAIRAHEGLEEGKGWYVPAGLPEDLSACTEIVENGIRYQVDFENGQKTGFFLDQKYNRQAAARLAKGRKVLDCFTHTGSFGLNAAAGGAELVTAVDVSASAVEQARENARRNGLEDRMRFLCADVFDLLSGSELKQGDYDFIILDPPAFTKSRQTVSAASRGYKEINLRAMRLLPRGGYLATCSCSHFMTGELFRKTLQDAARDAHVSLRQIEARQQGPDHPVLWNVPETDYLKFYLFQVV